MGNIYLFGDTRVYYNQRTKQLGLFMVEKPSTESSTRESGAVIHRRETNWQIYLPFIIGLLILGAIFAGLAIPSDPIWRDRVQAIGDLLYLLLCTIPILICMLPVYIIVLLGIYGMKKVHDGTERPLRKLENLSESLATRIEVGSEFVNKKTIAFSSAVEPFEKVMSIFEKQEPTTKQEETKSDV